MAGNDQKPSGNVDSAVRERLLRAAIDSFAAYGFEGSSLRTIAQQAGVAFQLITYYFGSKEDLWVAAVDYLFASRARQWHADAEAGRDFESQLRAWVRTAVSLTAAEPHLRRIMAQEFMAGSERYERHVRSPMRDAPGQFSSFLDQAQRRGALTRFSTREMLLLVRSVLMTVAVAPDEITSLTGGRIDNERTIDLVTDLLVSLFMRGEGTSALRQLAAVPNG